MKFSIKNTHRLYGVNYNDLVRVYYNFHKKTYSIQKKIYGRWLVVAYKNNFMLADCTFKVSETGRNRVVQEGKKNVHAFIYGRLIESGMGLSDMDTKNLPAKISYNPYKNESFVCENLTTTPIKIAGADCVKFNDKIVSAAYLRKL